MLYFLKYQITNKDLNKKDTGKMNKKSKVFNFDDKTNEELNARIVIALFEILYKQNKITKKEYDSLVLDVCRTFNI